ncbi:MAG: hypothetical protein NC395_08920 [Prevotella sp.]|nr:hypothetical protein [Prevotella sp.]
MAERCPLCGGETVLGTCSDCGFEVPDCGAIAAPYDLDPSNDSFGEAGTAEDMFPSVDTAAAAESPALEIPSVALPNIPSANSFGRFASAGVQPLPNIRVRAGQSARSANVNPPPANVQPAQHVQSQASPAVRLVKAVSDFVTKRWYMLLAAFFAPTAGILIGAGYLFMFGCMRNCKKYSDLFKGILFGAAGLLLLLDGFDPLGLDSVLRRILQIFFDNA